MTCLMLSLRLVLCLTLSFCVAHAKKVKDAKYYKLLGVSSSVSDSDLRKAYHKLALKWHPDKVTKKSSVEKAEAENMFKEISLAYDTLSDPKKRKLYDEVGEEGMKRGDQAGRGGGFQAGGIDPFKIFEQFFQGGGFGGGGFSFSFNMGGHGTNRQGLFADHPDEIETPQNEEALKELIAASTSDADPFEHQIVVILCTEQNGDCKSLKAGLVKLAKSNKGAVAFYAADCIRQSNLCRVVESDVKQYPCIVYYGYKQRVAYDHSSGKATARSLRLWLADLVPHSLVYIKTVEDHGRFLKAKCGKASIIYLTDKVSVPPKLKTLSMEFQGSISLAVLSKKESPDAFALFNPPSTLPSLYNVQTEEFVGKSGSELREYFMGLSAAVQKAHFQELTQDLYDSGVCSAGDYRFCLLVVFPSEMELDSEQKRGNLLSIGEEYGLEQSDPLRVVYVLRDNMPTDNSSLAVALRQLSQALNSLSTGVILWRPKWRRFEMLTGDVADAGALNNFVRSAFLRAALHGDRSLGTEHSEF